MITSNQISIPGFSAEQVSSLTTLIKNTIHEAFEKHFGPRLSQPTTQLVTQPATQPVTRQAMEQEKECPKPGNTEKAAEKDRARPYQASSADLRRLRTERQSTGNTGAGFQAFQLFFSASPLASPLGYIRNAEDMKATGQG